MPAEYTALGHPTDRSRSRCEDLVSIATLVGGIFGNGGGDQLYNAVLYQNMAQKFGAEQLLGRGLAAGDRQEGQEEVKEEEARGQGKSRKAAVVAAKPKHEDQEAEAPGKASTTPASPPSSASTTPTTPRRRPRSAARRSTTRRCPSPSQGGGQDDRAARSAARSSTSTRSVAGGRRDRRAGQARAAPGTPASTVRARARSGPGQRRARTAGLPALDVQRPAGQRQGLASGHPLAVMGPQVSYFAPQILMEEDIHGPGSTPPAPPSRASTSTSSSATAATTPGRRPRPGRTSSTPSRSRCAIRRAARSRPAPMTTCCTASASRWRRSTDHESWSPNLADSTAAGSVTFQTQRTAYGIVIARATIKGQPVVYTNLRSTYMHELDSAAGFEPFNDPAEMKQPAGLLQRGQQDRLHVQLVLHRRSAHRVLQLGPEPGSRRPHRPAVPDLVRRRLEGPEPRARRPRRRA